MKRKRERHLFIMYFTWCKSQVSNCLSKVENIEFQFQESGRDDLCGSVKCKANRCFFLPFETSVVKIWKNWEKCDPEALHAYFHDNNNKKSVESCLKIRGTRERAVVARLFLYVGGALGWSLAKFEMAKRGRAKQNRATSERAGKHEGLVSFN